MDAIIITLAKRRTNSLFSDAFFESFRLCLRPVSNASTASLANESKHAITVGKIMQA
jgi:hypothetical protein